MIKKNFSNPLESKDLFGLNKHFLLLVNLYKNDKFPKVLLLSGKKGSGKFTLVNHFLNYIFDEKSYDLKNKRIDIKSKVYSKILGNTYQNIILINNEDDKRAKIDDIRSLKSTLSKSIISDLPRFIVIDNVELLNHNSLNSLLKIIEEPTGSNNFILVDNQQDSLLETVSSRCIKMNFFLSTNEKREIINQLISNFSLEVKIDPNSYDLLPGVFLNFNTLCLENNINLENNYSLILNKLMTLYKKNKSRNIINFLIFYTEAYFFKLSYNNSKYIDYLNKKKTEIIKRINDFKTYNLNVNSVISSILTVSDNEKR